MNVQDTSRDRPRGGKIDDSLIDALIGTRRLVTPSERMSEDNRELHKQGGRTADSFYRERWSHDKVVRSTHGVNCTGSCSWRVFVKDGVITWEAQATDYPSVGTDMPEYEPRGCPRGASFSWYTYSPTRVRYPYVRGELLQMFREAKDTVPGRDPVLAWQAIVDDPEKARRYKSQRGKGGLIRASWDEAVELIAAAHVHTIKEYGPDRIAGFSPIPAMSQGSFASGSRFHQLIGAPMLSFYDWYADMPLASPQVMGDQTDVPESGDWWNSSYLIMWGSNVPQTRTPDAHYMIEARYHGQKVISVAPDYAESVKFADQWLAPHPGTDAALAIGMGHTILREFFVEKTTPYFDNYVKHYTDLPFLVALERREDGSLVPGKFVVATDDDIGAGSVRNSADADFKPMMLDTVTDMPVVPNGTLGHRYNDESLGTWNLELGDIEPALTLLGLHEEVVEVLVPRFDTTGVEGRGDAVRGVPVRRYGDRLVTTIYDLMLAQYNVGRDGLPGQWASGYDDAEALCTPAWQETITGVPAGTAAKIGREFAQNAIDSGGRSMIIMGSGTNHWFHSDTIYRTFLTLTMLCGTQGVNGGGWAHYVGQEKVRPLTGFTHLAMALDWSRPPRQATQTPYWYLHSGQWRYDQFGTDTFAATTGTGRFAGTSIADTIALSQRLGWQPYYPQFDVNPLEVAGRAAAAGQETVPYLVDALKTGKINFAAEDPDAPNNYPRIWSVWRANTLGSSAKGEQYFFRHVIGTDDALDVEETPEEFRPRDVRWRKESPTGKIDLMLTLDFRMTTHTLHSDVILPASTWYEKHDLSTTDMHPFVNSFSPAIENPWQARTDWEAWETIAKKFSELAVEHLGTRTDVVAHPMQHDSPGEMATPHGRVRDWKAGECEPVPGRTMPNFMEVERDYPAIHDKFTAAGPLLETLGMTTKGLTYDVGEHVERLRGLNGTARSGVGAGQPLLRTDRQAAEFILALSGTTNGKMATEGFKTLEKRTGTTLHDLSAEAEGKTIEFSDTQASPQPVITSPEWSGSESGGRRYSPFTINVERMKPWHTLTGRQHFYLDHDWMLEIGEAMPVFRPPLSMTALFGEVGIGETTHDAASPGISVRFLTPHSKWSIHTTYVETSPMTNLSRGGQTIWMSVEDAEAVGIADNDWIEAVNRNGVVAARAIVSHRMPKGTAFMYHAPERIVGVPLTERDGTRGGIHNSLTRIMLKPSHLIGGYAQLSYGFNYIGPSGTQRDEVTVIRKRTVPVEY
ncbi:MAG: nitrate reductase subunit alpha [Brachybacterium sp.]|nr:nitrate reductase subunit alpha [Brachybacterium sp.]